MAGVRLWVRGQGSGAPLAEKPRDALDLVQVLEQERSITSVFIVCRQHIRIRQAVRKQQHTGNCVKNKTQLTATNSTQLYPTYTVQCW